MRIARLILGVITVWLLASCSHEIEVFDIQFGSFTGVGTSTVIFRAETHMSRSRDLPVGWAFSMKNPPLTFTLREFIEGPPGTHWEAPPNTPEIQLSEDGRIAEVTKTISRPGSPFMLHNWTISSSDPIGKYKATLFIDGKLIKKVKFDVAN